MIQQKSPHIETLRGLAILFVVMGHVIGSEATGGMQVNDNSIYRYLYCLFENIRMPLFTVISGWVYALHPVTAQSISTFIAKKARRLILPLIFVGTSYFIIQHIIPGTNHKETLDNIWKIYVYPYTLFWYLPALFLVFSFISILEIFNKLSSFRNWLIISIIAWGLCFCQVSHIISESIPNLFAFKNALYLMPFFIIGLGLNRFKQKLCTPSLQKIYLLGTLIGIILQQINYFSLEGTNYYSILHLVIPIGMISSAFLVSLNLKNTFFIWLAQYAYTIYLFHGFGTSGGRILISKMHIHNSFITFIFATIVAVLLPIIIEKLLTKWRITRILFLGKK